MLPEVQFHVCKTYLRQWGIPQAGQVLLGPDCFCCLADDTNTTYLV